MRLREGANEWGLAKGASVSVVCLSWMMAAACDPAMVDGPGVVVQPQQPVVPAAAPDTTPEWMWDDSLLVVDSYGDVVSTSVIMVDSELGTARARKQDAVDRVGGWVIGGVAADPEGIYSVRVTGDGTLETIDSIAPVLEALPQVWGASPQMLINMGPAPPR